MGEWMVIESYHLEGVMLSLHAAGKCLGTHADAATAMLASPEVRKAVIHFALLCDSSLPDATRGAPPVAKG